MSEFNVKAILHELQTGLVYKENAPSAIAEIHQENSLLDHSKITFLPCDPSETFVKKKKKYLKEFDVIFISNALAHRVTDAADFLQEGGCVIVETAKYMLDLKKDQKEQFCIKVNELAESVSLKLQSPSSLTADADILIYTF